MVWQGDLFILCGSSGSFATSQPHDMIRVEQMSNIHFILELHYLTLTITTMVIPQNAWLMVKLNSQCTWWWECLSPDFILMSNYNNKTIDTKLVAIFPWVRCRGVNSSLIENSWVSLIFLHVTMFTLLLLSCISWVT